MVATLSMSCFLPPIGRTFSPSHYLCSSPDNELYCCHGSSLPFDDLLSAKRGMPSFSSFLNSSTRGGGEGTTEHLVVPHVYSVYFGVHAGRWCPPATGGGPSFSKLSAGRSPRARGGLCCRCRLSRTPFVITLPS